MTSKSRRRLRRRLSAALLLLTGLVVAGGLAATLTPSPQVAVADESARRMLRTGQAAVRHVVRVLPRRQPAGCRRSRARASSASARRRCTSRCPPAACPPCAARPRRRARTRPSTSRRSTRSAPTSRPTAAGRSSRATRTAQIAEESLLGNDVARGGDLFRLNCASCHNFTGKGGALSSGKYAPDLGEATPAQIYTAMLTGPQNMPKFSDRQLSPGGEARHRRLRPRGGGDARPRRLRSRWLRSDVRGHGGLDHRNGGRHRRRSVDRSAGMSDDRDDVKGTDTPGQTGVPGQPTDAELAEMSREELARTRRQDRRRRDRLQGGALAGRRHQGREARRTRRWRTGFCWRLLGSGAAGDLPVLAVGVQAVRIRGRVPLHAGHSALRR